MIWATISGARPSEGSSSRRTVWLGHQGPADGQHLTLATREGEGGLAPAGRQRWEHLVDLGGGMLVAFGGEEPTEAEVLLDGELPDDAAPLGHVADAETGDGLDGEHGELGAIQGDGAAARGARAR